MYEDLIHWILYETKWAGRTVWFMEQPEGVSKEELELCFIEQYVMDTNKETK